MMPPDDREALSELWKASQPSAPVDPLRAAISPHVLGTCPCEDGIVCDQAIFVLVDAHDAEITALHAERDRQERAHLQTIDERDAAQSAADELAYAIADIDTIGEHSSANNPWKNALDELAVIQDRAEAWEVLNRCRASDQEKVQRLTASKEQAEVKAALLSASQPSVLGALAAEKVEKFSNSAKKLERLSKGEAMSDAALVDEFRDLLALSGSSVMVGVTTRGLRALLAEVTALHAERDRLATEVAVANDAAQFYLKHATDAKILQREAEAEAARLRAALEGLRDYFTYGQFGDKQDNHGMKSGAVPRCTPSVSKEIARQVEAALASSGTVPSREAMKGETS